MAAPSSPDAIRDFNVRYHDGAAADYDAKWGIDWGPVGREQVLGKLRKALGGSLPVFDRSLEIGAGTGYFSLHLLMSGIAARATCSDISPGMLQVLESNAQRLGVEVDTRVADAEELPFEDESFDLVLGHAVLHHIPDLPRAFAEIERVLRPGGSIVFAGEPSRYGDRIAGVPKRAAVRAEAAPPGHSDGGEINHELERHVDVHAFVPGELEALAREAGFEDAAVRGEELLANWFGWTNRALEATAVPGDVPWAWKQYAFRGYLALQQVDRRVLEGRLPAAVFYNLLLSASKPA
jgi:SAM-dependent methyltransferase